VLKLLDRYLLRSFLLNYVLSLFVMISLYVTLHLFVNFDEFTGLDPVSGLAPTVRQILENMASYYGYNLFLYFAQISAVITLFAAALTFARLQRANERIAMLASGTSMYRVAMPVLLAGVAMNGLWFVDQEIVVPAVAPKLARPPGDVEGRRVYGGWCLKDGSANLLSASKFYPGDRRLAKMMVLQRDESGALAGVITADFAFYEADKKGWTLLGGRQMTRLGENMDVFGPEQKVKAETYDFYPSELTPDEIILRQSAQWMAYLSLSQLGDLQKRSVVNPEQVAQIRHARVTQPFNNLILMILGIAFFLTREPSRVIVQGGKALGMCAAAFIITFIAQQLVGSMSSALWLPVIGSFYLPPALPACLPILMFAPVCTYLLVSIKT